MHHPIHQPLILRSVNKVFAGINAIKSWLFGLALLSVMSFPVVADESATRTQYAPLFKYDYLSLGDQAIHSPGLGLAIMSPNLLLVGMYTRHEMSEPLEDDYPGLYHSVEFALDARRARHNYLAFFSSASDQPVHGGLNTYQAGVLYGYEVHKSEALSLVLGGGFAVGDFGLETSEGDPWPIIPVPLIRLKYASTLLLAEMDFIASPRISTVLGPSNHWRLLGELSLTGMSDARDIVFDVSAVYRLFLDDHPMGDFAGISAGVKNDGYAFDLGDDKGTYQADYYAGYVSLDATLLSLTGGYAFSGREVYDEATAQKLEDGFFVSLHGMYPF